jgi:DNA-binding transcriptional MerR regulator
MNISQLAQRTHIKAHTIRFYEKEGLVPQRCVRRRRDNYRDYGEEAVEGLLLIREGQLAGFTVAELKELISTEDTDTVPAER